MPRVKQFKEKEVLEKAMELFWEKGYNATSISDLVCRLGINRASLYDTFGGKRELFEKSFQLYRKINREHFISFLEKHSSVKEGLLAFFTLVIESRVADSNLKGCMVVNTATELIPCDESIQHNLEENRKDFEDIFHTYLEMGVKKGEISSDKDLQVLSSYLFMLQNGLQVIAKIYPDREYLLNSVKTGLEVLNS